MSWLSKVSIGGVPDSLRHELCVCQMGLLAQSRVATSSDLSRSLLPTLLYGHVANATPGRPGNLEPRRLVPRRSGRLSSVHDDHLLLERRFDKERLRLLFAVDRRTTPLRLEINEFDGEPIGARAAMAGPFVPFEVGSKWGKRWGTAWFRVSGEVPPDWGTDLELAIDIGFGGLRGDGPGFQAEALLYDQHGVAIQGVHPRRTSVPARGLVKPGSSFMFYLEAAANPGQLELIPSAIGASSEPGRTPRYTFARADLVERDDQVYGLIHDLDSLTSLMKTLSQQDPRRQRLLRQIQLAHDAIDFDDVQGSAQEARALLVEALGLPARTSAHHLIGVGHAHIDTAWLWPLRETRRKVARTFSSAVRLIDEEPDFNFSCSQAVQYAWVEQDHPELFEKIRAAVSSSRWEPVGGMWVEADMNLPSGESILRQLIHGQRAFENWFGRRCCEVWIPDVFGYPASMPQLFALGGATRFVTQKLSWNKQNKMPHHSFWWRGVDGTEVLTHFPSVDTYNCELSARELSFAEKNFRDHGWSGVSLVPYGYGDGGGGPTPEMLERRRRFADIDGMPRLSSGLVGGFFEALEADVAAAGSQVPVWSGELYFEMHRGTLTSQLKTKRGNLRCERLLREAEALGVLAGISFDELVTIDRLVKDMLVLQFHDILPGSSIEWVHQEAEAKHAEIAKEFEELIAVFVNRMSQGNAPSVFSARSVSSSAVEILEESPMLVGAVGVTPLPGERVALKVDAAPFSVTSVVGQSVSHPVETFDEAGSHCLTNGLVTIAVDVSGRLTSVVDERVGRELLTPGGVAQLVFGPDRPNEYEAWDIEEWTRHGLLPLAEPDDGPEEGAWVEVSTPTQTDLVGEVRAEYDFSGSTAVLIYRLRADSPRVDIDLEVNWHEREKVLAFDFPVDVSSSVATCGIQFGHVFRPRHSSTSWDAAKFEVCAHGWVDVSEPNYGVAILNDGLWGHDVQGQGNGESVRVTLLRSAQVPDPNADQGSHRVGLAMLPHGAGLGEVIVESERLRNPLRPVGFAAPLASPLHPNAGQGLVMVSALKAADDGSGEVVMRCWEALGNRETVSIGGVLATDAREVSITEEHVTDSEAEGEVVGFGAFEVKTFRANGRR